MEKSDIFKIAESRFDQGWSVAYIHLWGDPNRIRNFAGISIKKRKNAYHASLQGRLVGIDVFSSSREVPTLEDAIDWAWLSWQSYHYPKS